MFFDNLIEKFYSIFSFCFEIFYFIEVINENYLSEWRNFSKDGCFI